MTDIDLDALRADLRRSPASYPPPVPALIDAVQRRDDALAAVLALCDDPHVRVSGPTIGLIHADALRAAITAHLAPADNPTTED